MADLRDKQKETELEQIRRELRRRSLDTLRVFNPLDRQFSTVWDGFSHIVPPKKEADFPRYIAEKWLREIVNMRINEEVTAKVKAENDTRNKRGWFPMNPQEREQFEITNNLRSDNPTLREKYIRESYRGVTAEYGFTPEPERQSVSKRFEDADILSRIDEEVGVPEQKVEVEETQEEFLKEVSDEQD